MFWFFWGVILFQTVERRTMAFCKYVWVESRNSTPGRLQSISMLSTVASIARGPSVWWDANLKQVILTKSIHDIIIIISRLGRGLHLLILLHRFGLVLSLYDGHSFGLIVTYSYPPFQNHGSVTWIFCWRNKVKQRLIGTPRSTSMLPKKKETVQRTWEASETLVALRCGDLSAFN